MDLHKFNMSELDKLNQQLKASMTVIDVQVPDEVERLPYSPEIPSGESNSRKVSFAAATMKTDHQRASMEDELLKFRQQQARQAEATVKAVNPFASR